MITKESFGVHEGKNVTNYILDNGNGLRAEIIDFGGIVKNLYFDGKDVVLGRDTMEAYSNNCGCLGALIGRNSNRIENACFTLNGKEYKLAKNNGEANLHGGNIGYNKKVWDSEAIDGEEPSLKLSLFSPDGDEGFPGNVNVTVTYTLTKDNALRIHYEGSADADTILNMTNHSYFNLNGHDSGTVDGHRVKTQCSFFTPNNDGCMPYGEVLSVENTPFDFTSEKTLGEGFASDYKQVRMFGGFDHNFVIDGRGFRHAATVSGDKSGIVMDVFTDLPGVQIYTANMLDAADRYKGGAEYGLHAAICLETQCFPNAMKYAHFPSTILRKGEKYDTVTEYRFSK